MTDPSAALTLANDLTRLWSDDRFVHVPRVREFINVWLVTRYTVGDAREALMVTLRRMGPTTKRYMWSGILGEDAPCYDGMLNRGFDSTRCSTPKTRGKYAGDPCGRSSPITFRVTDPATGEWRLQGWCRNHQRDADIMRAREAALTGVPEPLPNRGGLLPSYIPAKNWPNLYRWARPRWEPPYVGIVADDWPTLAKAREAPIRPVPLRLIDGGNETTPATPPPALTIVR